MIPLWGEAAAIVCLILVSGFFSAAEIALIAIRKSYVKQQADQGRRWARRVQQLQSDPERFLATVQIGVTLTGLLSGAVGGLIAVRGFQPLFEMIPYPLIQTASEALAVGCMVIIVGYLTLVIGELVPKSVALRYPEKVVPLIAGPLEMVATVTSLANTFLTFSTSLLLKPFGVKSVREGTSISEEEIKFLLTEGRERGVFDRTEQELILSVFQFNDIYVKEVMIPRPKIRGVPATISREELLAYMADYQFSRYPVYTKGINDIFGILHYKDVLRVLTESKPFDMKELARPAYFAPETMKISRLLKEMQRRRVQMAIVINEYGSVEGIVTMEDLIEEIVGEIRDESDVEEKAVERLKDGTVVADASLSIRDLREDYGFAVPDSPEYETLGGFVLHELQDMPRGGDIIRFGGYKLTIVDMEGRRISKVKIEKLSESANAVPSAAASS
ncbi:MAG: HlyC/CorC family transporter [Nitrospirae bacterium]|nr:HlyC/CorC family transporter [Nitrospirota bacterium]